ncbi:MAG: hypothetical protein J0M22_13765 [Gammaproteobacteria bacterium]|mgnify:CR=1 FL=1|jgi:hypothetical protein|nr:hypothetical protein [Gammaproteobacteria bacterium]
MSSNFLAICGPLQLQSAQQASGRLDLAAYQGELKIDAGSLLLEGIHQAAVRLGRTVIQGGTAANARVLPVAVQSFTQLQQLTSQQFEVICQAEAFGHAARVKVSVSHAGAAVAAAELTVALI